MYLKTKLYIPPVRPGTVPRLHLIERLQQGLSAGCKLALVSAPAGFGKTTLVSEWVHQIDVPVAWVSLDSEDNNLTQILNYLVAALQTIDPELGREIVAMFQLPQPPPAETMLTLLVNSLAERNEPLVLVLDDYHEITAAPVHDALLYLLTHLPPHVHLVIATRADPPWPLARMRTRHEMIELRAQDLRFTPDEAATFLRSATGLSLPAKSISELEARTEGWIAGLQMAALAMQVPTSMQESDTTRAEAFIQAFSGSHRFVLDYLVEEVLDRQSDDIQTFLLHTSILDRLCGPLCDAVLDKDAGSKKQNTEECPSCPLPLASSILESLDRANLFLVPLDDERCWYRYHHLFADLLRKRLHDIYPDQVSGDHKRASAWYESQGAIHEAVMHAQAAGDEVRVVYLIERYAGQALMQGEFVRVGRWIEALPEETIRARPLLCLVRAWILIPYPDARDRAVSWLERALTLSAADPHPVRGLDGTTRTDHEIIRQNALLFHVNLAIAQQADPEELIDLCMEALEGLPEGATFERSGVTFYLAQAYQQLHDGEAATRTLAQARQLGQAVEGHSIALAAAGLQAIYAWDQGDLHAVVKICREAIGTFIHPAEKVSSAEKAGPAGQSGETVHPYACLVYVGLGRTLAAWNQLEEAESLLVQGVKLAEQVFESGSQVDGCRDLARLYWMQGDFQQAHAWMDKAMQACLWDTDYLDALRARIWLAQAQDDPGWLDKAIQWADARTLVDPGDYSWELQSLVRVRIAQYRAYGKPDLLPVLTVLDGHIAAPASKSSGWQVEVMLLKALLLQALGRIDEAMSSLAHALAVAQTTGRVLIFLEHGSPMVDLLREAMRRNIETDYARQILAAFEMRGLAGVRQTQQSSAEAQPSVEIALVEPFSERELQVLRLLNSTLSQREIADQLYLSINTVRTHCKHIYAKLDVHSRIEAIDRAEALGLL